MCYSVGKSPAWRELDAAFPSHLDSDNRDCGPEQPLPCPRVRLDAVRPVRLIPLRSNGDMSAVAYFFVIWMCKELVATRTLQYILQLSPLQSWCRRGFAGRVGGYFATAVYHPNWKHRSCCCSNTRAPFCECVVREEEMMDGMVHWFYVGSVLTRMMTATHIT